MVHSDLYFHSMCRLEEETNGKKPRRSRLCRTAPISPIGVISLTLGTISVRSSEYAGRFGGSAACAASAVKARQHARAEIGCEDMSVIGAAEARSSHAGR